MHFNYTHVELLVQAQLLDAATPLRVDHGILPYRVNWLIFNEAKTFILYNNENNELDSFKDKNVFKQALDILDTSPLVAWVKEQEEGDLKGVEFLENLWDHTTWRFKKAQTIRDRGMALIANKFLKEKKWDKAKYTIKKITNESLCKELYGRLPKEIEESFVLATPLAKSLASTQFELAVTKIIEAWGITEGTGTVPFNVSCRGGREARAFISLALIKATWEGKSVAYKYVYELFKGKWLEAYAVDLYNDTLLKIEVL